MGLKYTDPRFHRFVLPHTLDSLYTCSIIRMIRVLCYAMRSASSKSLYSGQSSNINGRTGKFFVEAIHLIT
jgi:hypothetical protein